MIKNEDILNLLQKNIAEDISTTQIRLSGGNFREVAIWSLVDLVKAAYEQGQQDAKDEISNDLLKSCPKDTFWFTCLQ